MRFTLERGKWYACEFIGDEFGADKCSYSPIKVKEVIPGKTGKGVFELHFHPGQVVGPHAPAISPD